MCVNGYDLEKSFVFEMIVEFTSHARFPIHMISLGPKFKISHVTLITPLLRGFVICMQEFDIQNLAIVASVVPQIWLMPTKL